MTANMESTVLCNAISKVYHQGSIEVHALGAVDLAVFKGEFIALCGPSGSGKTTLLNIIGGLDRPTSGSIRVAGIDLHSLSNSELSELRLRHIGFVFQAYNLIPVLTARENVEFVMQLQGVDSAERKLRSLDILAAVGLSGLENRRPADLSGGQQQRVAVARSIVANPSIVLADEPTANLDSQTAKSLLDLMRHMNEERKVTFIFSTHDRLVMEYAQRIVRLRDGKIVSEER